MTTHPIDTPTLQRRRLGSTELQVTPGLDHIPLLHLHDPERISFEEGTAPGGPLETLVQLKEEGLVDYIGVAGGRLCSLSLPRASSGSTDGIRTHPGRHHEN